MKAKKGISLIVLVITIIVIIILAGAVILNVIKNNPIESAKKARFQNDLDTFKSELSMYVLSKLASTDGNYDVKLLNADEKSLTENGDLLDEEKDITDIITSMNSTKYPDCLEIISGELVYVGNNQNESNWSDGIIETKDFKIDVAVSPDPTGFSGSISLTGLMVDINKITYFRIYLSTISGEHPDTPVQEITNISDTVDFNITENVIANTDYYITIEVKMSNEAGVRKEEIKVKSSSDILAPNTPQISVSMYSKSLNITPIAITLTDNDGGSGINKNASKYIVDTNSNNYSESDEIWTSNAINLSVNNFIENIATISNEVTTEGEYYVHVLSIDNSGNKKSSTSSKIIIDLTNPIITIGTNGGTYDIQASTNVNVTDILSGVNSTSLQYVWDTQNTTKPSSGWITFNNGETITKRGDGSYYLWINATDIAGNNICNTSNKFVIIDNYAKSNAAISEGQTVNSLNINSTINGKNPWYNNPVIPAGFNAINTTDASWELIDGIPQGWDNGLVIQDSAGNQFVWVPVDGINVKYEKWTITSTDDSLPTTFNVSSITNKYKGFYISRYEAAFNYNGGNIRVANKKSTNKIITPSWSSTRTADFDGYLWNWITYPHAKQYSESMDTSYGYNTELVGTNLISGTQWDTVLKWIQNSGKSVTNSRAWGNYNDPISPANVSGSRSLQASGFSEYWKAKNIYDLAGNIQEWTNDKTSSPFYPYIIRDGGVFESGSSRPVKYNSSTHDSNTSYQWGFRTALYII